MPLIPDRMNASMKQQPAQIWLNRLYAFANKLHTGLSTLCLKNFHFRNWEYWSGDESKWNNAFFLRFCLKEGFPIEQSLRIQHSFYPDRWNLFFKPFSNQSHCINYLEPLTELINLWLNYCKTKELARNAKQWKVRLRKDKKRSKCKIKFFESGV